jgi:hypothetical protein
MNNEMIKKEFHRHGGGAIMPSAFTDHVQSNPSRSVAECLDDTLPFTIHKIEIPEGFYDLDEGYESARKHNPDFPPERPPVSFPINAKTWRELGAATRLFDNVGVTFDIFPCNVFIEKDVALVCCET